jgi:hypothetical protein
MKRIYVFSIAVASLCVVSCKAPKSTATKSAPKTTVTTPPSTPPPSTNSNRILFTQTLMTQSAYRPGEKPKVKVEISEGFTAQWSSRINRLMPDGSFEQVDSIITAKIPVNSPATIVDFIDTRDNGRFVKVEIPSADGTILWAFFKESPDKSMHTLCVKDDKDHTKSIAWAKYKNDEVKLTITVPDPAKMPALWVNLNPRNVEVKITN